MYVDSHAHLEMEQFNADREQVLTRARDNGCPRHPYAAQQ